MAESIYPEVPEKLSYEKLAMLPVITPDMTAYDRRKLCVDFFKFTNSFLWTPKTAFDHYPTGNSTIPKRLRLGKLYSGLCYTSCSCGNVYRILDYYDDKTGVLDFAVAHDQERRLIGSQCSTSVHWAWARVQCAARFDGCFNMVEKNGCRKVGSYQYDPQIEAFTEAYGTGHICKENGEQVMYESYALLQPGDALVYFTTAGHVIMSRVKPWVDRDDDGKINPKRSHVMFLDQSQSWKFSLTPNGEEFAHMPCIDSVLTFEQLYNMCYLPITLEAFDEEYKAEEPWVKVNIFGETVTPEELKKATVTSNYALSDVYVTVKDTIGNQLYRKVVRADQLFCTALPVADAVDEEALSALSGSKIELLCQSGTGIRKVLYSGILK